MAIAAVTISVELVASDVVDVGDVVDVVVSDVVVGIVTASMAPDVSIALVPPNVVKVAIASSLELMIASVAPPAVAIEYSSACVSIVPVIGSKPTPNE